MDDTKPWWASKGCWSNIFQVATSLGVAAHFLNQGQAGELMQYGPELVVSLLMTVLGFLGLYGRVVAKKKIAVA